METFKVAYKILFNLEFELTGNTIDLNQYIKIVPDHVTNALYPYYRILPKHQKNSAVFLIQVVADGPDKDSPKFALKGNEVFRFQVKFASSEFMDTTHLSYYDLDTYVLYLTNEVNHTAGSALLLSTPVDVYNGMRDYRTGYIVQSGSAFFKAIKNSNNADQHGTSEAAYWKNITNGDTYVSQADLRDRASITSSVDRDTAILIEVNHKASLPAAYQLTDGSSKCREVSYKIKLLTGN